MMFGPMFGFLPIHGTCPMAWPDGQAEGRWNWGMALGMQGGLLK